MPSTPLRPVYAVLDGLMFRYNRRPEGSYGEQVSSGIASRAWHDVHFCARCEACFAQAPTSSILCQRENVDSNAVRVHNSLLDSLLCALSLCIV